ncbi:glutaredoxin family protein [Candidatus Poribacteria bacterium]|nr:glutaredoxin family protein [Candidatus Poribacteria bacterium]
MKAKPIKLQLYTKSNCSLCDEAKDVLRQVEEKFSIQVEEIDITTNLGLFTKYKYSIPVLEMDKKQLFIHRIDRKRLQRKLMWRRLLDCLAVLPNWRPQPKRHGLKII